jgi:cobalt-zinc-cadmium resistance protein CzcA
VQKPLAIVVVSGMAIAPILILLILPALMAAFSRRHGMEPTRDVSPIAAE